MRYLVVAIGLLFVVGALAGTKAAQISTLIALGKEAEKAGPPPEAVGAATALEQRWEQVIKAVGTVTSSVGVSLKNEVAGVVARIGFESGQEARAGQMLIELDTKVERAELASALANQEFLTKQADRSRALHLAGGLSRADYDAAQSEAEVADARVKELRAVIARKTVVAPFAGRLGIRGVNVGQYLAAGQEITVLETARDLFVDFTLPQGKLDQVDPGLPVRIEGEGGRIMGTLGAIEPAVDPVTREARLRARVPDAGTPLRAGMFVDVAVVLPEEATVVVVPTTAVVHAPYGDSIYVIDEKKPDEPGMRQTPDGKPVKAARQRFVRTGEQRGDFTSVLEGVRAGEKVVSAGAFKLRNNAPIIISDQGVAKPQISPRPENR